MIDSHRNDREEGWIVWCVISDLFMAARSNADEIDLLNSSSGTMYLL